MIEITTENFDLKVKFCYAYFRKSIHNIKISQMDVKQTIFGLFTPHPHILYIVYMYI